MAKSGLVERYLPFLSSRKKRYDKMVASIVDEIEDTPEYNDFMNFLVDRLREMDSDPYIRELVTRWDERP